MKSHQFGKCSGLIQGTGLPFLV